MALTAYLAWLLSGIPATPTPTPTPSSTNPWLEPPSIIAYIAILVAIIGTAIMWRQLYYGKLRKYKELTWSMLADTPLISIDSRAEREKVQILYDGHEVEDIHLVLLKIWSSGTDDVEIYSRDEQPINQFEIPYWFIFEERTVKARSVSETDPPGIIEKQDLEAYNQHPDPETNAISLPHCLFKPKRAFTLRVLLTGKAGEIRTRGQLVGCEVKEYKSSDAVRNISAPSCLITASTVVLGLLIGSLVTLITIPNPQPTQIAFTIIIAIVIPLILVLQILFTTIIIKPASNSSRLADKNG
jgi:uncharacterized membrane protein